MDENGGGSKHSPGTPRNQKQAYNIFRKFPLAPALSPDSEHRQRRSLLIQKQRRDQEKKDQINASDSNVISGSSLSLSSGSNANSNTNSNRISSLELESFIRGDEYPFKTSKSSKFSWAHMQLQSKCRAIRTPNSPGIRRFGSIMGITAVFCIIIILREQHVQDENSMFQFGVSKTKSDSDNAGENNSNNHHTPMQALGKITPLPTTSSTTKASSSNTATTSTFPTTEAGSKVTGNLGLDDFSDANANGTNVEGDDDQFKAEGQTSDASNRNGNTTTASAHQLEWQTLEEQEQQQIVQKLSSQQEPQQQQSATKDHPNMPLQYPLLPLDTSNNHSFVYKHCDLQGTDWFPYDKELAKNVTVTKKGSSSSSEPLIPSWHQRAPFLMILGPPHGGSDVIYQLLSTHPQVADAMQSHFFTFNHKLFVTSAGPNATARIRTRAARQAYMARHVSTKRQLQKYPSEVVMDNVPETLLYSKRMAPFVLCVMPWVKIVITVSHPVRRLLKHYQQARNHGLKLTLEEWIARDLDRMQEAGLLVKSKNSTQTKLIPGTNHDAWNIYQQLTPTAMDASAGQSLYEFMVHPWFTWMEKMGRNPQTEILLVQRELLIQHGSDNPHDTLVQEYQRIVKRLGLAPHKPPDATVKQILAKHKEHAWIEEIDKDLRRHLRRFFKPYNDRFDQFLQSYYHTDGLTATNNSMLHWNPALWKVS